MSDAREAYPAPDRTRRDEVQAAFIGWISEAREIVDRNFAGHSKEAQNAIVASLAQSMMLSHRLAAIETALDRLTDTLSATPPTPKE
jgi:hypothetical protein